mmetsp:Transcript_1773/g.7721  ORF Transcript_1773/g.7721 Transcript_1773/m.7721 type:complete len:171 (-) Transcript_1773:518-1030(-)
MQEQLREKLPQAERPLVTNFHFGYPHLLQRLRGETLKSLLEECRSLFPKALLSVDLNGVTEETHSDGILTPCLPSVDVLHLNEDEADILAGDEDTAKRARIDDDLDAVPVLSAARKAAIRKLHEQGVAVVLLSIGTTFDQSIQRPAPNPRPLDANPRPLNAIPLFLQTMT